MIAASRRKAESAQQTNNHLQDAIQLAALVRECQVADIARNAVVVRLSRLKADKLRPHHLRLARAAMEPLAHADRARLFTLPNRDLVVVWRGPAEMARATCRIAIVHMFVGDDSFPITPDRLWEEYALPADTDAMLHIARLPDEAEHVILARAPAIPLDPSSLATFEAQLVRADVARFVRRHPIAAPLDAAAGGGFHLVWEKRKLNITELAACLSPQHDLKSDPWLFRRLTRTLDRRMLALLAAPGELVDAGPFALNINIGSILGPEFLKFDTALPNTLRGRITLDLVPEDVLADPAAFLFARDFARARGYRLVLHGITTALLPILPVKRLGLDLVHLRWSADMFGPDLTLLQTDATRLILGNTDTADALEWGIGQGIGLFCGKLVQNALRPNRLASTKPH
jgi:hypothetical protein